MAERLVLKKATPAPHKSFLGRFDEIRLPGSKGGTKLLPDLATFDTPVLGFKTFDIRAAARRGEREPGVTSLPDFITVHSGTKTQSFTGGRETGPSRYVALVKGGDGSCAVHFIADTYTFTRDIAMRELTPDEAKAAMENQARVMALARPAYVPKGKQGAVPAFAEVDVAEESLRKEIEESLTETYR